MELDPQVSPEEIMSREGGAGLQKLGFFRFGLFLNSSATDIVPCDCLAQSLKQQLRGALVAVQWRGDTALTLPLFWRRSTISPVFSGGIRGLAFTLSALFPLVPVRNKQPRFCGRKAAWPRNADPSTTPSSALRT